MTETEQIILEMGKGFGKIHDRLNAMAQETTARQLTCSARFSGIEQSIAIRSAVNGIEAETKKRKVDFQSYLVRGLLLSCLAGILIVIGKIFLGHIDLIVKPIGG